MHCLIQVKFKFLHPATMLLKLIRHKDLSSDEMLRCELSAYDNNHSAAEMLSQSFAKQAVHITEQY